MYQAVPSRMQLVMFEKAAVCWMLKQGFAHLRELDHCPPPTPCAELSPGAVAYIHKAIAFAKTPEARTVVDPGPPSQARPLPNIN